MPIGNVGNVGNVENVGQPIREGHITSAMTGLKTQISELDNTVSRIEERFSSVLRIDTMEVAENLKTAEEIIPLASAISIAKNDLKNLNTRLLSVLDRCEL